jgi:magnesium transporter
MGEEGGKPERSKVSKKADIFVRKQVESSGPAEGRKIEVFEYTVDSYSERTVKSISEISFARKEGSVIWVNIDGFPGGEEIELLNKAIGLHPIILDDILNPTQRPKSEDFGQSLYLVIKMFYFDEKSGEIISEQVSLILQKGLVVSVQEKAGGDAFNWLRERIRTGKGKTRKSGEDYLIYRLLDSIVENYFKVLEKVGERIEALEEALVENPSPALLHAVYKLKREVLFLRKSVWPLREAIRNFEAAESDLVKEPTRLYLREVYDHTIQVIDTVETFLEMLSEMLDTYLSSISNKINEVMKVLTIITTIFMPLSFIAGVYGMNFVHLPGISSQNGPLAIFILMATVSVGMLFYFRKKKWI